MQARYQWNKNFSNGDRYAGEAIGDNVKDGQGEYLWAATGAVYKGSWSNDRPHGEGVMSVPDSRHDTEPSGTRGSFASSSVVGSSGVGTGYTYEGHFERGQRSGYGICRFTSGRVYTGEWEQDEMSGQGTLTGAPGGVDDFIEYTGPFLRGRRHGANGCCRYANGDVYTGDWLQGKRHGLGRWTLRRHPSSFSSSASPPVTSSSSAVLSSSSSPPPPPTLPAMDVAEYAGAFLHDIPACNAGGEIRYTDGSTYTGGVSGLDVRRDGRGELRLANGDVYTGHFRDNVRDGEGSLTLAADGHRYEGTWRADQLDGHVTYEKQPRQGSDGDKRGRRAGSPPQQTLVAVVAYTGPCQRNEFTGLDARVAFADGSVYRGEVLRGQPTGDGVLESRTMTTRDGLPTEWFAYPASGEWWDVVLSRYEGSFSGGRPNGTGTGTFRFVSSSNAGEFPVSGRVDAEKEAVVVPKGAKGLRINYRRNGTFTGKWAHGVPSGHGCWSWDDGDVCDGEVQSGGLVTGHGRYQSTQATYEGDFQSGQPHGRGAYQHRITRERYDGEWAKGLFHGQGEYHWFSRELGAQQQGGGDAAAQEPSLLYRGGWQNGTMCGTGTEKRTSAAPSLRGDPIFADAPTVYEGGFRDGLYDGPGKLTTDGDAVAVYEGEFTKGTRTGRGRLTLGDGTTVEGPFRDGQPHGNGVVATFPSEITYRGAYADGRPCDTCGSILYPNGDQYTGEVESAAAAASSSAPATPAAWVPQRHGKGSFTFAEGNVLTCTWRHNVLHGEGVYKTYEGDISTRTYVDGVIEARTGPAAVNVFTAENELPNTLSEDALRRASVDGKKRFSFVRKGEGGGATAAAAAAAAPPAVPPTQKKKGNSPQRIKAPAAAKHVRHGVADVSSVSPTLPTAGAAAASTRTRKAAGSPPATSSSKPSPPAVAPALLPAPVAKTTAHNGHRLSVGAAGRRRSDNPAPQPPPPSTAATAGSTTPSQATRSPRKGSHSQPRSTRASLSPPTTPRSSGDAIRSKEEVRAAIARRMSARPSLSTGGSVGAHRGAAAASASSSHSPPAIGAAVVVAKRPSLVEAFQKGIREVDGAASTTSEKAGSSSSTTASPVTRAAQWPTPAPPPPRGPMKGQLRTLMDEACAIRNSREDEIQLLTDELRVLNEKIWQLRFTMSDAEKAKTNHTTGDRGEGRAKDEQRLATMVDERKGTVEKLSCLLHCGNNEV